MTVTPPVPGAPPGSEPPAPAVAASPVDAAVPNGVTAGSEAAAQSAAGNGAAAGNGSALGAAAGNGAGPPSGASPRTASGEPAPPRIARSAALIASLTALSRMVGFGRILVFTYALGATTLGDIYQAANTTPNIIFEIVANGALAALVVPLVAGAASRHDRQEVSQTASGLLTWILLLLVPAALVVEAIAHPLIWLLYPRHTPDAMRVGTEMLRVFAPQLPLYGVGIVISGVLQAHRRFAWPVLAPLLSSLTVIGVYLTFAAVEPGRVDIPHVGRAGQLILSVGTTLGVVVLSMSMTIPLRRLGLRLRPTLRLNDQVRKSVRELAWVAVITAAAQQLTLALLIALANWDTPKGSLVHFTQAQTVYLVPWAVLAVPVATSAYPALATAVANGAAQRFRDTLASATRSVLLLSALGAAALVALAWPMAWILAHLGRSAGSAPHVGSLSGGIIGFAPGLLGYGVFALHSRALYARRDNRWAALAMVIGWGGAAAVAVVASVVLPAVDRVPALTASNSTGMLLLGGVIATFVRRRVGAGALAGVRRAAGTAVLAGTLAAAAGIAVRWPLTGADGTPGYLRVALSGMLSGVAVVVVFVGVVMLVDRHDAGPMLTRLLNRVRPARRAGAARLSGGAGAPPEKTEGDR
ncbi:lipid II flippase MurJ [Rugosimonospora acidiphila]|uniref:Lipid II flippase MurJ n=1 Tax=Rugosimonospora acidiphila TaxID=556531 RepID=A0ABP9S7J9_9ACTN